MVATRSQTNNKNEDGPGPEPRRRLDGLGSGQRGRFQCVTWPSSGIPRSGRIVPSGGLAGRLPLAPDADALCARGAGGGEPRPPARGRRAAVGPDEDASPGKEGSRRWLEKSSRIVHGDALLLIPSEDCSVKELPEGVIAKKRATKVFGISRGSLREG